MRCFGVNVRLEWLARMSCVLILALAFSGCGGGGGGSSDSTAPTIGDVSFNHPVLNRAGTVTVTAPITDSGGIAGAQIVVTPPSGAQVTRSMTLAGSVYTASYDYPANISTQGQVYAFVVRATDLAGNTATSSQFKFTVPAPDAPPPPPFTP